MQAFAHFESKNMDLRGNLSDVGRRRPGRPGITDEQAENVRALVRRVRDLRYGGNSTALSAALGYTQSAVSQMLSGKNRPSYDTVLLLARLLDADPNDVLAGIVELGDTPSDRYPERARALARLRGMLPPPVLDAVRGMVVHGDPFSEAEWIRYAMRRLAEYEDEQRLLARVTPDGSHGRTQ